MTPYSFLRLVFAACALSSAAVARADVECSASWQTQHPTWIWCDDFEADRSSSWADSNGFGSSMVRSSGNGYNSSYSLRAIYPATSGVANGGDWMITFGNSPITPNVKTSSDVTEVYFRVYVKTSSNWQPGTGAKAARLSGFVASDWTQSFSNHYWGASTGNQYLSVDPASGICRGALKPDGVTSCVNNTVITSGWNDTVNYYWLGLVNGTTPVFSNSRAGTWQCLEGHTKLNTSGNSDGVQEMWIDDVLEAQKTGLNLVGDYAGTYKGINIFRLENYMNSGTGTSQYRDWDNVVVSTTRIGCALYGSLLEKPINVRRSP